MNEKMKTIRDYFEKNGYVSLAKQCKQEYIIYSYYRNYEGNGVQRMLKQHFKNRDLEGGKTKRRKIDFSINRFFDEVVYDLINRGYELEDWQ